MFDSAALDLRIVAEAITKAFPIVTKLSLFGSRRHRTRSLRSDIDLLVDVEGFLKPSALRDFALKHFPAVDPFIVDGKRAVSCMNDSFVEADSRTELGENLQAVEFWTRADGIRTDAPIDFEQLVARGMIFQASTLPNLHIAEESRRAVLGAAESNGMPAVPYVGETAIHLLEFLVTLLRRLIPKESDLRERARWAAKPLSEYEFQGLFWIAVKPWLPGFAREEVTIHYDGQEKRADFNYAKNQIVVEMKHVKDSGTKAAVVKTLQGLANFYARHPNIRGALFAVLVDEGVEVDAARWEADFSHVSILPHVRTIVVPNRPSR